MWKRHPNKNISRFFFFAIFFSFCTDSDSRFRFALLKWWAIVLGCYTYILNSQHIARNRNDSYSHWVAGNFLPSNTMHLLVNRAVWYVWYSWHTNMQSVSATSERVRKRERDRTGASHGKYGAPKWNRARCSILVVMWMTPANFQVGPLPPNSSIHNRTKPFSRYFSNEYEISYKTGHVPHRIDAGLWSEMVGNTALLVCPWMMMVDWRESQKQTCNAKQQQKERCQVMWLLNGPARLHAISSRCSRWMII